MQDDYFSFYFSAICLIFFCRKCEQVSTGCFTDVDLAAEFVVASVKTGWDPGVPLKSVSSRYSNVEPEIPLTPGENSKCIYTYTACSILRFTSAHDACVTA